MRKLNLFLKIVIMFIFLSGCGSHSLEEYKEEGEGVIRSLLQDLKGINNREQLLVTSGKLQKHFDRLIHIMIAADEYRISHSEKNRAEFTKMDHELSDQLRMELNRIYTFEGGRQIIEKCQEKALHRLDAYQKKLEKNK